ncbi:MAG: hypothetical protein EOO07_06395 [Chitinophagaceae bacterium]|nr:MAG: hypothetical protein EOO07_06395 [Chitinophagaceae bacterium]
MNGAGSPEILNIQLKIANFMAKVRSIIKLSGTLTDLTFVDSKAYGAHARAKRGTYTPISLSEGMQKSAEVQKQVNLMAKVVFDAVNGFVPGFKDGKFWPRLLSVFRKQQKAGEKYSYKDFDLMEMRLEYPTSKHGFFRLVNGGDNKVQLHYQLAKGESYRLSLLRIASDETLLIPYTEEVIEVVVAYQTGVEVLSFAFTDLPAGNNVLWVLHCEQLNDGLPIGLLKSRGLKFFG